MLYGVKIYDKFMNLVKEIKRVLKELVANKEAKIVMGGDNNKSQLVLIPLGKLKDVL